MYSLFSINFCLKFYTPQRIIPEAITSVQTHKISINKITKISSSKAFHSLSFFTFGYRFKQA